MIVEVRAKGDSHTELPTAEQTAEITRCSAYVDQVSTVADVAEIITQRARDGYNYAHVMVDSYDDAGRITDILTAKHYTSYYAISQYHRPIITIVW